MHDKNICLLADAAEPAGCPAYMYGFAIAIPLQVLSAGTLVGGNNVV